MFRFVIPVFVLIFAIVKCDEIDYCQSKLCPSNVKHIKCGDNGNLGESCPTGSNIVDITPAIKEKILHEHNRIRSLAANGELEGLEGATRMLELQWDDELADMAAANARTCKKGIDQCHKTQKCVYSGQNVCWESHSSPNFDREAALDATLKTWFDEHTQVNMTTINKFTGGPGRFTSAVGDRQTIVGCALGYYPYVNEVYYYYLVCNYCSTNLINLPVYKAGEPCSECKSGCNEDYPGLCCAEEAD